MRDTGSSTVRTAVSPFIPTLADNSDAPGYKKGSDTFLDVKAEQHDVAVMDDVVFAF